MCETACNSQIWITYASETYLLAIACSVVLFISFDSSISSEVPYPLRDPQSCGGPEKLDVDWGVIAVMTLGIQTWVGTWLNKYLDNGINTPAWAVGAFLMLYMLFPTCLRMIRNGSSSTRKLLLFIFYGLTAFASVVQEGVNVMVSPRLHASPCVLMCSVYQGL